MEHRYVFVLPNGTIEHRIFPKTLPHRYLVPVMDKTWWHIRRDSDRQEPSCRYEEYTHRGTTFDGHPIYCSNDWDIQEAAQVAEFTKQEACSAYFTQAIDELQQNVTRFVSIEYPDAILIDSWQGDVPLTPAQIADGLERTQIRRIGTRHLVAIPHAATASRIDPDNVAP